MVQHFPLLTEPLQVLVSLITLFITFHLPSSFYLCVNLALLTLKIPLSDPSLNETLLVMLDHLLAFEILILIIIFHILI